MIEIKAIVPPMKSTRVWPVNIISQDKLLFNHAIHREVKGLKLFKLTSALVTGWGVLFVRQTVLNSDVLKDYLNSTKLSSTWKYYINIFKRIFKGQFKYLNISAILIVEESSSGYFHWMTEALPRLLAAEKFMNGYTVLIPGSFKQFDFIKDSLQLLQIPYIFLERNYLYKIRQLGYISHYATAGNYNDASIKHIRSRFTDHFTNKKPTQIVYISRSKAGRRKIANEIDLQDVFNEYGVQTVFCEDLTVQQQVVLFYSVKVLIANHGAGLTNMIAMQTGSNILELRYKGDSHNNCYFTLASALGLEYYYQQCLPTDEEQTPHLANVIVDKQALQKNLDQILK